MWRILLLCLAPLVASADQSRCPSESKYNLSSRDPVYADAISVKNALTKAGVNVECVTPSTMVDMFEHQTGAAFFRTTAGFFELLVLDKPYDFDALEVIENGSVYSFRGGPARVENNPIRSPFQFPYGWQFIKRQNQLLACKDTKLAARLKVIIGGEFVAHP
jgi:hypothetical protein